MGNESTGADNNAMDSKRRPYFGMTGKRLNVWITIACTTAMTLFGYDQGVFGGIIVTPDFLNTMGNPNPTLQGTIVSLYDIGCFLSGSITWRFPIAFQLVFSFILLSTAPWLPESPRWLLAHDHYEEGLQVLAALEGNGATTKDDIIIDHAEEILAAARSQKAAAQSWSNILRGGGSNGMIQRLLLGAGTQWMQQLAGINVTSY
ncbi:hypothetical protein C0992_005368 [Termitomyces sp. T32_za158]|nr:hypothetical protein C0992_005368 [Termitomyces sp. T32_za158]